MLNLGALTGMSGSLVVTMLTHIAIRITAAVAAVMLTHFDEIRPGDASIVGTDEPAGAGVCPKVEGRAPDRRCDGRRPNW